MKGVWIVLLAILVVLSSLLAGIYVDLIVQKVSSWDEVIDAFGIDVDFARREKWHGYFPDQETTGEWKINNEIWSLTSFIRSNRITGIVTNPENKSGRGWDIVGYIKSDTKFIAQTGEDIGAGFYLLKAIPGGLPNKPKFDATIFTGFWFGYDSNNLGELKFRRCPYVLIRERDVQQFSVESTDIRAVLPLPKTTCDDLVFPELALEQNRSSGPSQNVMHKAR